MPSLLYITESITFVADFGAVSKSFTFFTSPAVESPTVVSRAFTLLFKTFPTNFSPPSIASRRSSKLVNDSFTVEATAAALTLVNASSAICFVLLKPLSSSSIVEYN